MKRSTIIVLSVAIIMVIMGSCKKQEQNTYSFQFDSFAYISLMKKGTIVNVSMFPEQNGNSPTQNHIGNITLVMSSNKDMTNPKTITLSEKEFNGDFTFNVSSDIRPFNQTYWYYIELQAPYSEVYRSDIYEMPIYIFGPEHSFSIADSSFVLFAIGNLQYQPSTDTWRLAYNQYDTVGNANKNISSGIYYTGWIDLFGFGTSGYRYKPSSYALTSSYYANGNIYNTNHDWGVYSNISNGCGYSWKTLTSDDWFYIFYYRPDADQRRSRATVVGIYGYILLPDDWTLPSGLSFTPNGSYSSNNYNVSQWRQMEANGAVFLPAAGYRKETTVYGLEYGVGSYFTSSWDKGGTSDEGKAYCAQPSRFYFNGENVYCTAVFTGTGVYNAYGSAVRLVRTVQAAPENAPRRAIKKVIPYAINPIK